MEQRIVYLSRLRRLPLLGADGADIGPDRRCRRRPRLQAPARQRSRHRHPAPQGVRRDHPDRRDRQRGSAAAPRLGQPAPLRAQARGTTPPGRGRRQATEGRAGHRRRSHPQLPRRAAGRSRRSRSRRGGCPGSGPAACPVCAAHRTSSTGRRPVSCSRRSGRSTAKPPSSTRLHPAEMAAVIRKLPLSRRQILAAELEDERFADLLEELSEDDQVRLIEGMDLAARLAGILDEMDADDAADLIGELPEGRQDELLTAMDPEEAEPVRRLLQLPAGHRRRADDARAADPRAGRDGRRGARACAGARHSGAARRRRVHLPAAARDPDRPLPRQRRLPATAA